MKSSMIALAALASMAKANLTGDLDGVVNGILKGGNSDGQSSDGQGSGGNVVADLAAKLGIDLSLPGGLSLPQGSEPTGPPGDGCTNVYHPPHSGVDIDGCDDYSNNGWHYVHPGTPSYGNQGSYTWGTSTQYATQVSTVIACPTTVHNCPASSSYQTTITVPTTTTICPLQAHSTYAPAPTTYLPPPVSTPVASYVAPASSAPYVAPAASAPYVAPAASAPYVAPAASAPYVAPAASAPYVAPAASAPYVAPAASSPYNNPYVATPTANYIQPSPIGAPYGNGTIPYGSGADKVGFSFAAVAGLVAAFFM